MEQVRIKKTVVFLVIAVAVSFAAGLAAGQEKRPRAREIGVKIGILPTGQTNAITDVAGVTVGQTTIVRGQNVRTGGTVLIPNGWN